MDSFSEKNIREDYRRLTLLLIEKKLTIASMESCTSGQIASLITDTEGSSAVLKGSLITYSNEIKAKFGVQAEVIDTYSVYSLEVAEEMAKAVKSLIGSDIGIGVTGTMGNIDPENSEFSKEGEVYFSIIYKDIVRKVKASIPVQESRLSYKLYVAKLVYDELISVLS